MEELTLQEIGLKLKQAGRLPTHPLCIYGTEHPPDDSIPSVELDRCIAKAIYLLSTHPELTAINIGLDETNKCCPGGQTWLGYKPFQPMLKYFLSTGTKDFRNGQSEFLIATPELSEQRLKSTGKISALGTNIIIHRSDKIKENDQDVKAFLCFGTSEQIRNLCALSYFRSESSLGGQIAWGPSCASFVSYPAGMIEKGPKNSVILGPTDPTGNYWFPDTYLSIGIPLKTAKQMAEDLELSFIGKRPKIAYPPRKE